MSKHGPAFAILHFEFGNPTQSPKEIFLSVNSDLIDPAGLSSDGARVSWRSAEGESFQVIGSENFSGSRTGESNFVLTGRATEIRPGEVVEATMAIRMAVEGEELFDEPEILLALTDHRPLAKEMRERWRRWTEAAGIKGVADEEREIIALKALQTLVNNWRGPAGRLQYSGMFPSSAIWYFNGYWAWHTWKQAVGTLIFDPDLAQEQVREMFRHQDENGMIADVVYLDASEDNWRDSKPPLAGWAIEIIFLETGDRGFVHELYPKLKAYHEFWYAHRDHDGDGLCEYGSADGTIEAARWESGMDNAVRFDHTKMLPNGPTAWSMDQESVDLNSYLFREKKALAVLASAIGLEDDARRWRLEAEQLKERIQQVFFDSDTGWFYDVDINSHQIIPVQGPEGCPSTQGNVKHPSVGPCVWFLSTCCYHLRSLATITPGTSVPLHHPPASVGEAMVAVCRRQEATIDCRQTRRHQTPQCRWPGPGRLPLQTSLPGWIDPCRAGTTGLHCPLGGTRRSVRQQGFLRYAQTAILA